MAAHHYTPSGRARARALGVNFEGVPGTHNAITDVPGVEVGYRTLISGEGRLRVGEGPVRTGVTAILPRGRGDAACAVFGGFHSLNGNGEMTGCHWLEESGQCEGPITITNTHSCGTARDATVRWLVERHSHLADAWGLPIAAETFDGVLNDINGFHVSAEHVMESIDAARGGGLELGSLGGGTGMICYDFKGGNGSASRTVAFPGTDGYLLGVFVQANFGRRAELTVTGVPIGRHITGGELRSPPAGSVIAVVATDAPLLPHQCKRLARRVSLGLARTGTISHNGSGDIFLAFSTANRSVWSSGAATHQIEYIGNEHLDGLFAATVHATEEAVIDAMVANESMTGRDDRTVPALPHDRLKTLLAEHARRN